MAFLLQYFPGAFWVYLQLNAILCNLASCMLSFVDVARWLSSKQKGEWESNLVPCFGLHSSPSWDGQIAQIFSFLRKCQETGFRTHRCMHSLLLWARYGGSEAGRAQLPPLWAEIPALMYPITGSGILWEGQRWLLRFPVTKLDQEQCFRPSRSQ